MKVDQDRIQLSKEFPFQINEVVLKAEDNCEDSFHWHSFFEITYVESGAACYYVNGKAFEVSTGDIIIFNNVEPHGWQILQQEMHVLVMIFSADFIAGYGDLSDMEYLQPFIERGSNFRNKVRKEDDAAGQISSLMKEILMEWEQQKTGSRLMIKADVLRILTMLIRHYQNDEKMPELLKEKKKAMKRLQGAFDYIDRSYCGKVTLSEAAAAVYMSPNYFSSYFHRATELSFSEYVTMQRIRKANELLATTEKSIYEIAMACGFPNLSNFYRLYKKHTGVSPRNHR